MKVETYTPSSILRPFVKAFTIIESSDGMVNKLLPDTSIVMAFNYQGTVYTQAEGKTSLPVSAISGLRKSPRIVDYSKETAALLVVLNEGSARSFSDVPVHELFGLHVPLDNFIHRQKVDAVVGQLADARHHSQRFSIVEEFMISQLREPRFDPLIHCAVEQIKLTNGDIRIKDLITRLSISRDAFEKRFSRTIGTSPKQFAKIVRFRNLIKTYPQAKNLTNAALDAGYFDQAHFIKDFTAFTGTTPKIFFRTPYVE